jgi:hypothetical protein
VRAAHGTVAGMLVPVRLSLLAVAAALVATAAGCGGSDFSGPVDVPKGYVTVRADGVSYVRPAAFRGMGDIETAEGLRSSPFGDPRTKRTPQALVTFSSEPNARDEFESRVSEARVVIESTDGKVKSRAVDVKGADKAYRLEIDAPRAEGSEPVATHNQMLMVLLRDGTAVSLTAGGPERDQDALDADAVIDSFRVQGQ